MTQVEIEEARVIMKFFGYTQESIRIVEHSWWLSHAFSRFMRGGCEVDELIQRIDEFLYHKERGIKNDMRRRSKYDYN